MAAYYERLSNDNESIEMCRRTGTGSTDFVRYSASGSWDSSGRGSVSRPGVAQQGDTEIRYYSRTRTLNAELLDSVTENRRDEVERILDEGGCVNATCSATHVSAVHLASMEGRVEILTMLLDRGAVAVRFDLEGRSPLHLATRFGHSDGARILLTRCPQLLNVRVGDDQYLGEGTDAGWMDCDLHDHAILRGRLPRIDTGASALHVASQFIHLRCVELLLQAGADVNTEDDQGLTPLDVAGEYVFDDEPSHSRSPLHSNSFLRLVQTLVVARGTPGQSRDRVSRHTPLHAAVRLHSMDAISRLKAAGYATLVWDKTRTHPVHVAVLGQIERELEVLISVYGHLVTSLVDGKGFTPLHLAVMGEWLRGTKILLHSGADIRTKTTEDSSGHELETVLHLAARSAHSRILRELLKHPDISEVIDELSGEGQPPLFHAVFGRSLECVNLLLEANVDVTKTDKRNRTVLHWAAEYHQPEVLSALFALRGESMKRIQEATCNWGLLQGTALHIASYIGDAYCVKILIEKGCNPRSRMRFFERPGFTALHLAANSGRRDVIKTLLDYDVTLVNVVASEGWMSIHLSCQYGLKECVHLLIAAGSDLSAKCKTRDGHVRTAMDLLVQRVRSPVDLLREVFDSMIVYTPQTDTYVNIDYKVLLPDRGRPFHEAQGSQMSSVNTSPTFEYPPVSRPGNRANQMKVIDALLQTGDQQDQQSLLMHPLVESFLYLQWKTLSNFYYGIILMYTVYILSFTIMVVGIYNHQDRQLKSEWSNSILNLVIVVITLILLIVHEIILFLQTRLMYFLNFESWLKICCYCVSLTVLFVDHQLGWPRELTAAAVLLAWVEFMFLISRVPRFGYCVLMFTKVATNLFRVLLTFAFLIIGFAISFMVEFHLEPPFNSTTEAFIKTIIMMTGEFDYSGLFDNFVGEQFSLAFAKSILMLFVLLVSIVLMNLLVAMAVTDIKDLDIQGKIDRLRKEAEFVSMFEKIIFDNVFLTCLPLKVRLFMQHYKQAPTGVQLCVADESKDGIYFPEKLRRSILERANTNRESQAREKKRAMKVLEREENKMKEQQTYEELTNQLRFLVSIQETKLKRDEHLNNDEGVQMEDLSRKQSGCSVDEKNQIDPNDLLSTITKECESQNRIDSGEMQQVKARLYSLENDQQDMQAEITESLEEFNKRLDIIVTQGISEREPKLETTAIDRRIEDLMQAFEVNKQDILSQQREILIVIGTLVNAIENLSSNTSM